MGDTAARMVAEGRTALGIELGSTRIKACLVDAERPTRILATGIHRWENDLVDGLWSYDLDAVRAGLQDVIAQLLADAQRRHGIAPGRFGTIGVSAMMHGYLAFDAAGALLVPFRTWRNTNTTPAVRELSARFGRAIPHRWSVAHLRQAMLDGEEHVPRLASLTTLSGYVHRLLTGRHVLGVGDASGMFPIDRATGGYDAALLASFARLDGGVDLLPLLPEVLTAGADAGVLTPEGARLLDPSGHVVAGIPFCPPEGDAGTGMVATNAVAPRTGNVSVGTSVFAMVVLERPLAHQHDEIDLVMTPAGDPVAMVHCNNGAGELDAWAAVFAEYARAAGASGAATEPDVVFEVLLRAALDGSPDAGGVLVFNQVAGEPVIGLAEGRPMLLRPAAGTLTLADLMRAQIYGIFAALRVGLGVLDHEGVEIDRLAAHGGLFRTAGVAQRLLAGIVDVPVGLGRNAAEGGAWGMAVLAAFRGRGSELATYLDEVVFAAEDSVVVRPDPGDVAGFASFLARYRRAIPIASLAATRL